MNFGTNWRKSYLFSSIPISIAHFFTSDVQMYQTHSDVAPLYPMALSLCGSWLGETRSKSPSEIIDQYLEKSVALMEERHVSGKEAMMDAYLTLARYTDNQYRRVERHMESSAFEAKRSLLQKNKVSLKKEYLY